MQAKLRTSALSLALAASALGMTTWSPTSHACAGEPYLGAVCIMATPSNFGAFGGTYTPAMGQLLSVNQYQALYAVLGNTFGGTYGTNFNLPDLRGRVVLGSGISQASGKNYPTGQKGGAETGTITGAITLTAANLPAHSHTLNALPTKGVTVATGLGTLAATTTLTGLTATTSLSNVTANADGSKLTLNGSSSTAGSTSPSSNSLATTISTKIYVGGTPSTPMAVGSISGSAPVTFNGAPSTTITGTPTTTLAGTTTATVSGTTDPTGSTSPTPVPVTGTISTMPPYLAMNYYIAIQNGLFPVRD